ncbi:unnamed protein product [Oppiella nova]|uniref:Ubiquitin carboxyl-terminal hydrolase 36 n=1 Tax=Oppiella nova TaxID=334625 RepID=A0A7R9QCL0_9ACAR|nr:unnamed protein product [Oppiella nova]CAG2162257.1 unnamed protein product [Oppiella nova]
MSAKTLQTKYNVLTNDGKVFNNNVLSNDGIKLNGQMKMSPNVNSLMNGNSNDNTSDGLVAPKHVLFLRERVLLDWKQPQKIGAGLHNLGNTCFLNSVLQCLSYCPPLVNYLLHTNDHNTARCAQMNQMFCMVCEMARLIRQTRNSGQPVKPIEICRRLKAIAKHFQLGRQEDAHEFLRYVVDNMWKSCLNSNDSVPNASKLDPKSKETTAINQIFGGYHRSQVTCFACKAKSNTYDYFMDFMLDIKNANSLEKALEKFVTPEILQNENSYKCTRCKRKTVARKQFTIYSAPNVATFQLKRFDYHRIFGGKITKPVTYPERLNLRPYMSDNKGAPIIYKLNSVLVHLGGSCNSGHYFCYVRNSNNSWYLMDDSRTVQVNQNQALSQQAYVLFYVRVDTDFHKPAPVINGLKLKSSPGLSPELFRNQNHVNNVRNDSLNSSFVQRKPLTITGLQSGVMKVMPNNNNNNHLNHKQNTNSKSVNDSIKQLVPYDDYDSSDEDNGAKQTAPTTPATVHMNGSLKNSSNCDKRISGNHNENINNNSNNNRLSAGEHKSHELAVKSPQKSTKLDNISIKLKTNTNQIIPNPKHKSITNSIPNHTSECASNCVPLAPITIAKVKATTSSWHVVESCGHRSPSITSNSSTNSVNSTTEWTVSDCSKEFNGTPTPRAKHKHRNKQQLNGCPASGLTNGNVTPQLNGCPASGLTNGNVTPVLSTKQKLPQSEPQSNGKTQSPSNAGISDAVNHSSDNFVDKNYSNKASDSERLSPKKNDLKPENRSLVHSSVESNDWTDSSHQRDGNLDRRLNGGSHRSPNDSGRDCKPRDKKQERSHSKSANNSSDDESDAHDKSGSHKHEKRKRRKHRSHSSDSDEMEEKIILTIKHKKKKKKKMKKKKHKKRDMSGSDESGDDSGDDNGLQWVERTKETVEKERDVTYTKPSDHYEKRWDENVRDLSNLTKKRPFDEGLEQNKSDTTPAKPLLVTNEAVVNGLLKASHRAFGDKVNSWNGGPSHLDTSLQEESQRSVKDYSDDYDEEFDRGKTKKVKTKHSDKSYHEMNGNAFNPFQKVANDKQCFNGTFNANRNKSDFGRHQDNGKHWDKPWNKSHHKPQQQRYDHHNHKERRY